MREKFLRFMMGRYGNDRLNQFLMMLSLACMILSFFRLPFFYFIAVCILGYACFRMFSRETAKRAAENQKYWKYEVRVKDFFDRKKRAFSQRKEYRIYKCPACKQKLRVPRGRGKIEICCRKCGTKFIRKS